MSLHIFKWIRGWFPKHSQHEILLGDAIGKVVSVIDQALAIANGPEAQLIEGVISDEGQESIEKVKAKVIEIRAQLVAIQNLPDVAQQLQSYRFAGSDELNEFLHELVTTAATAFSDNYISLYEAVAFFARIADFIKKNG